MWEIKPTNGMTIEDIMVALKPTCCKLWVMSPLGGFVLPGHKAMTLKPVKVLSDKNHRVDLKIGLALEIRLRLGQDLLSHPIRQGHGDDDTRPGLRSAKIAITK